MVAAVKPVARADITVPLLAVIVDGLGVKVFVHVELSLLVE